MTEQPTIATSYVTDAGTATPALNILNVVGTAAGIDVTASGNTVTVAFDVTEQPAIPTSITTNSGTVTPSGNTFSAVGGGSITTSGSGATLTITDGGLTATQYTTNSGTAIPAGGNLNVLGGTNGIDTVGSGSTITINFDVTEAPTIATSYVGDSGTATPSANVLNVKGTAAGIDVTGSGNTLTIAFDVTEVPTIATTYAADSGTAQAAANIINFVGGGDIATSATGSTVTITNSAGPALTYTADTGTAQSAASNINFLGGTNGIDTTASGSTITFNFDVTEQPTIPTSVTTDSGTCTPDLNTFAIVGDSAGIDVTASGSTVTVAFDVTEVNTLARLYTADSGTATPSGGNINILGGSGGIDTVASGATVTVNFDVTEVPTLATSYVADSGTATPALNVINIKGGTNGIDTVGSGSTITINFDVTEAPTIATTYTANSGSATPSANNLNILGTGSISTSGSGSTITIAGGGSPVGPIGVINLGMVYTSGTGTITIRGANGSNLSASNPAFITLPSNVTVSKLVTYTLTSNYTFRDANAGASSAWQGSLFGQDSGDNMDTTTGSPIGFYIYPILDNTDQNLQFMTTRMPNISKVYDNTGNRLFVNPGLGTADTAWTQMALNSLTIANYQNSNTTCIGTIDMYMDGTDDWYVHSVDDDVCGIGRFSENDRRPNMGTSGASPNSYFRPNGGTVPSVDLVSNNAWHYQISREGLVHWEWLSDLTSNGVGAVQCQMIIPIRGPNGTRVPGMSLLRDNSAGGTYTLYACQVDITNAAYFSVFRADGTTAQLLYNQMGSADQWRGSITYLLGNNNYPN